MRFLELIPLTASVVNFAVTLFVLTRNLRARVNWVYLLWGSSIAVWNLGTYWLCRVETAHQAVFWARVLHTGVIFLPISGFHLCMLVTQVRLRPELLYTLYAFHLGLAAINLLTPAVVASVRDADYAYYSIAGWAYWFFAASYTALSVAAIVIMHRRQRALLPLHRRRVRILMGAMAMLIVFGANDILPILGWFKYPFTDLTVYPLGSAAAIFYGMLVGYSALQHELLDVRITLSRVAAHAVRILFVFLTGFVLLLLVAAISPEAFSSVAFASSLAVVLISATIASVYFPRLFGRSEALLERWILADQFEYRDKVRQFIASIPSYSDTDLLMHDLHRLLVDTIQARRYQIVLQEQPRPMFALFRAHPEQPPRQLPELDPASPLLTLFRSTDAKYLAFNIAYAMPAETDLERAARRQLQEFDPEFCFPFFSGGEPFGLLLLGEKADNEFYTPHDLELLVALVNNLGLVINQIRLKNQILLAEELELLGRMSRGMAHDLNNLITPVWTYLQLAGLGAVAQETERELLPHALRSIEVIHTYIKEALFVSEHKTPLFRTCEMVKLVHDAVVIHEPLAKAKGAELAVATPAGLAAEVEPTLVQRLLANLLVNAIDASQPGSRIHIELAPLAAHEPNGDWLRLLVRDQGVGMSPDLLERVGTPYYTTKDHGDQTRGFGLGLAICRKIVHLHHGHLSIESLEREGTTVRVELPARQTALTALAASATA